MKGGDYGVSCAPLQPLGSERKRKSCTSKERQLGMSAEEHPSREEKNGTLKLGTAGSVRWPPAPRTT